MSKVLILNPPSPDKHYINRDLMGGMGVKNDFKPTFVNGLIFNLKQRFVRLPVVQLVYAATIMKKEGFDILVIDAANECKTLSQIMPAIEKFMPDYVLMACSASCFIYERDMVAKTIKKKCPGAKIIVEGDMINERPDLLLPHFDIAILGEGEQLIVRICKGEPLEAIPGIIYSTDGKEVKKTKPSQKIETEQLMRLPFPDWSLFPYKRYRYYPMITKLPFVTIQASRGCPYGCGYCPYPVSQGLKWRARDAGNIFDEMKHNYDKFGVRGFFFRDPLFSLNQQRVEELCELVIGHKLKVGFVFETRPELLKKETIKLLAMAGCQCINFGIEDIHPDILKNINREPIETSQILETMRACRDNGIGTTCFFIIGLPGSTKQTIKETIDFSITLLPNQVEYKVATPFPGTSLYFMAKSNKWLKNESFDALGGYSASMQISDELTEEDISCLTAKAFRRFYCSPRYLTRELFNGRFFKTLYFMTR
jgi:anaerobic magnesium-protoporphyrin IX monomethyl ester cyclase